jgi:hypothetical protein
VPDTSSVPNLREGVPMGRGKHLAYGLIFVGPLVACTAIELFGTKHSMELALALFLVPIFLVVGFKEEKHSRLIRPNCSEYGPAPCYWVGCGLCVYLIGSIFSVLGIGFIGIIDKQEPSEEIAVKAIMGAIALFFGILGLVAGLQMIIKRKRLKIVLSEQALHVTDVFRENDVPYSDIRKVETRGEKVVLEIAGRSFYYPISDSSFSSELEKKAFVEELFKRIGNV